MNQKYQKHQKPSKKPRPHKHHKNNSHSKAAGQKPPSKRPVHNEIKDFSKFSSSLKQSFYLLTYDSFQAAKADKETILKYCREPYDQVNIAIKAEGNMDDPELLGLDDKVKVYAGEAWFLIHQRRLEEDWYPDVDKPQETKTS